jgi:hypothetical protein
MGLGIWGMTEFAVKALIAGLSVFFVAHMLACAFGVVP